jgi:outer membrane murein-binding lipoprotein Lpp
MNRKAFLLLTARSGLLLASCDDSPSARTYFATSNQLDQLSYNLQSVRSDLDRLKEDVRQLELQLDQLQQGQRRIKERLNVE